MNNVFTVQESLELLEYGVFRVRRISDTILSTLADPTHPGDKVTTSKFTLNKTDKIIVYKFNWGDTSISDRVYYELYTEAGLHSGSTVGKSNIVSDIIMTSGDYIEVDLWNVSNPAADVYVDMSMWYYQYALNNEDKVMEIFSKNYNILQDIYVKMCLIEIPVYDGIENKMIKIGELGSSKK